MINYSSKQNGVKSLPVTRWDFESEGGKRHDDYLKQVNYKIKKSSHNIFEKLNDDDINNSKITEPVVKNPLAHLLKENAYKKFAEKRLKKLNNEKMRELEEVNEVRKILRTHNTNSNLMRYNYLLNDINLEKQYNSNLRIIGGKFKFNSQNKMLPNLPMIHSSMNTENLTVIDIPKKKREFSNNFNSIDLIKQLPDIIFPIKEFNNREYQLSPNLLKFKRSKRMILYGEGNEF